MDDRLDQWMINILTLFMFNINTKTSLIIYRKMCFTMEQYFWQKGNLYYWIFFVITYLFLLVDSVIACRIAFSKGLAFFSSLKKKLFRMEINVRFTRATTLSAPGKITWIKKQQEWSMVIIQHEKFWSNLFFMKFLKKLKKTTVK